jgi:hypothetical protein
MGHEIHMIFLLVLLTKMTILTKCWFVHLVKKLFLNSSSRCPWFTQINHIKWSYLIKLAILIWVVCLLIMLTRLPTYLPITYLCLIYLPIYLPTIYLPMSYLPIYLSIYLSKIYLCTFLFSYLLTYYLPIYLPSYLPTNLLWKKLKFKCCYTRWQKNSWKFKETC